MPTANLLCSSCGRSFSTEDPIWSCPTCDSMLELRIDLSPLKGHADSLLAGPQREGIPSSGVWRFAPLLPVDPGEAVSLGEGGTPVVQMRALGRQLGLEHLYAKLEFFAPTGSFKDRGTTVMVSKARDLGVSRLVEDSSGNAGASIAAYCARAGIEASIYVPALAPQAKKAQIAFYGAEVVEVEGSRERVAEAALERCRRDGAYYASHNWNPFFLAGTRTFAYEVAGDFHLDPPEHLVMPVGNGSLFLGSWMGFGDLRDLGLASGIPRHHLAQATGCMPIVDAFRRGMDQTGPVATAPTIAGGISIARPSRGHVILRAMRESGGGAAAVSDEEILECQRALASLEGIFCEPTSAAAFAALPGLIHQGSIDPRERVLVAVTGIGLKDPGVLGG